MPPEDFNLYAILKRALADETPLAVANVVSASSVLEVILGTKMLIFADGRTEGSLGFQELDEPVRQDATALLASEKSRTIGYQIKPGETVEVYIESILPPPPLVIIGADPDAVPIVKLGKTLGFKVILVDHRDGFANSERYPEAAQTIVCQVEDLARHLTLTEKTFVLVKTHHYMRDRDILKFVLKSKARYVGQLGPKARMDDLLADLEKDGVRLSSAEQARLYAPTGLDLGAESPEQIALSVLAEMLAVKNGRRGSFLRDQIEAIHPRD